MQASAAEVLACGPEADAGASPRPSDVAPSRSPPLALCLLARLHHISADPGLLAHELGLTPSSELTDTELLKAAQHIGLMAKLSTTRGDRLSLAALPALARIRADDGAERWVLLAQCDGHRVLYQDPAANAGTAA